MSVDHSSRSICGNVKYLRLCLSLVFAAPVWAQIESLTAQTNPLIAPAKTSTAIFPLAVPLEQPPILWEMLHPLRDPHDVASAVPSSNPALPAPLQPAAPEATCHREASEILTLPQAINQALCHNVEVRAAWNHIQHQAAQLGTAQAAYWPTANAALSRIDDRVDYGGSTYPATHNRSNRSSLNINWRVFDFGTRNANLDLTHQQLSAAIASRSDILLKVVIKVLQAHTEALAAQATWQIRISMQALSKQTLGSAQRRESLGVGSRSETLQAEAALNRIELQVSQAEGAWLEAHAALTYLLGLPASSVLQLPVEPFVSEISKGAVSQEHGARELQILQELNQWLIAVRENHPSIIAAQAQWRSAAAKLHATQAEGMPNVDISFGYYKNGRPTQDITSYRTSERVVALTLNIPLFDGFAHTYRVQDARAQAELKRIQYEDTTANALQEFTKLYVRAQAAWRNLQAAGNLLQASILAQASERRKFERGVTDLMHLLQSQNNLFEAQLEYLNAHLAWNALSLELMTVLSVIE